MTMASVANRDDNFEIVISVLYNPSGVFFFYKLIRKCKIRVDILIQLLQILNGLFCFARPGKYHNNTEIFAFFYIYHFRFNFFPQGLCIIIF